MSKYFLVPDLHGELDMAAGLLSQEGLLNSFYERTQKDVVTVQMGDFLNCVVSSINDDNRCLDHEHWFDVLLVGNHEHPYFGGPAFNGFFKDVMINHRLHGLDSKGRYKVAINCDGVLVTHAGVTTDLYRWMHDEGVKTPFFGTTSYFESVLNDLWQYGKTEHPFSSISWNRGGPYKTGGILWADWKEYKTPKFKQIVGHSVGDHVRIQFQGRQENVLVPNFNNNVNHDVWESLCLDLGAGKHSPVIVGAWIVDGNVKLVEYRKEEE